jgi:hypothetical protein
MKKNIDFDRHLNNHAMQIYENICLACALGRLLMKKLIIALLSIIGLLSTPACATSWAPVQTIPAVSPPSETRGPVSLAYDTTNNLMFAAWLDDTTGSPFFSIFNNISGTWSTPAQIANSPTNNAIYLSYDSSAKIMVATWNDSSTNNPFYSFYNGSVWSSAAAISNAFVAFDGVRTTFDSGTGNIIAAWSDNNFPFNPIYSIYTSNTNTWTTPQTITIQQVFDDVTLTYDSGSNQVFAAWIGNNTGLPFYAILTAGIWTSASINLTNPGSTQSKNVLLTYDTSNEQVYAAWGTIHPLVSVFSNANPTWSTPIAISSLGALNSEVTLGYSSASEQVVAAWLDSGVPRYAITDSTGATWTEGVISPNPVANTAISLAFDSGLNEMFAAWSNASSGSPSDPVYSTLLTQAIFPGPVTSLKGVQKINTFVTASELYNQLNWRPPTPGSFPVLSYHIYRNGILIATLPPTKLSFHDHNRKPGVIYLYAVAASDINGEGPQTTIAIP